MDRRLEDYQNRWQLKNPIKLAEDKIVPKETLRIAKIIEALL